MAFVQGGSFIMGDISISHRRWQAHPHRSLSPFYIDVRGHTSRLGTRNGLQPIQMA
jgi:hypothetical protein